MKNLFLCTLLTFFAIGCGAEKPKENAGTGEKDQAQIDPSKKPATSEVEDPMIFIDVDLPELSSTGFPALKKQVYESLRKDKKVNFYTLMDAITELEAKGFTGKPEIEKMTVDVASMNILFKEFLMKGTDPHQFKISMEETLEKKLGKKVIYRKEKSNIFDLTTGYLQCRSGSLFFDLAFRLSLRVKNYQNSRSVFILSSGHIQPGYIIGEKEQRSLVGIESTNTGKAKVKYGLTKDLWNRKNPVLVVDSNMFMVALLFTSDISDFSKLEQDILVKTAKMHGIEDLDKIQLAVEEVNKKMGTGGSSYDGSKEGSIFSFGEAHVPEGDIERISMDEQDDNDGRATTSSKETDKTLSAGGGDNGGGDGDDEENLDIYGKKYFADAMEFMVDLDLTKAPTNATFHISFISRKSIDFIGMIEIKEIVSESSSQDAIFLKDQSGENWATLSKVEGKKCLKLSLIETSKDREHASTWRKKYPELKLTEKEENILHNGFEVCQHSG